METELLLLWIAICLYVAAGSLAIIGTVLRRQFERAVPALLVGGLVVHGVAIGLRWERLGHGPYLTMFEILSSNVWSLLLIYVLVYLRYRPIRPTASVVLPVMFIMMGWMMLSTPKGAEVPQSFDTVWLWIHIGFGKVFFGSVLVALGMAGVILLRSAGIGLRRFAAMPDNHRLDDLAYRFMALGFIFESLMLVAGAIWAQDAWGRYWGWDPVETWSFLTWLVMGFALHTRVTLRPAPVRGAVLVVLVFVFGFLTFFGVPFITEVPHQGTF